jgi:hypothetical protein
MGGSEISSEFEYSASFLSILIPGILVTTLVSFLLVLNYSKYLAYLKESIAESVWALLPIGVTFVSVSIFIGLMINIVIIPLTRVLEGYSLELHKKNHFIKVLRDMFKSKQLEKFVGYRKDYESGKQGSLERGSAYTSIYEYFSHCLYELSNNPKIKDNELKKCLLPTKLGNVFRSLEIYPKWKYGMDSIFFWTRIELLMSEENKKTMDRERAFVDMFIGLTWIFFFASIVYFLFLAYNEKYIFSVVSLVVFISFSLLSYKMAVQSSLSFGHYVRSIFDLYRKKLWDEIKNNRFDKLDSLSEKERWENVHRYLWFYNVIQCKKCGKFYEKTSGHSCNP